MSKLSIIIPAYNEGHTIRQVLQKVATVALPEGVEREVVLVDDCSTDNTAALVKTFFDAFPEANLTVSRHDRNLGKGAALHTGIALASGDIIVVQDADLEYDPNEYSVLLQPILDGHADVVYGSRFMGGKPHRILFFWHTIGNRFLTFLSNMLTNLNLTDMESGFKMFRAGLLKSLDLQEQRFGFEPEVTAKMSQVKGVRVYEVGISYYGRTYEEGKKVNWQDGVRAIFCILKYNLFSRNKPKGSYAITGERKVAAETPRELISKAEKKEI